MDEKEELLYMLVAVMLTGKLKKIQKPFIVGKIHFSGTTNLWC